LVEIIKIIDNAFSANLSVSGLTEKDATKRFWIIKAKNLLLKEDKIDARKDKDNKKTIASEITKRRAIGKINDYIRAKLIEYGKMCYHFSGINIEYITSFDLEAIKAVETITKKINNSIVFAISSFRNIVGAEKFDKDILENYETFRENSSNLNEANELQKYFNFNIDAKTNAKNISEEISNLLYAVRNKTFHYNAELKKLLSDKCKNVTEIKNLFYLECEKQTEYISEKYASNNVHKFYAGNKIKALIKRLYSKQETEISGYIPSFKKVFSKLDKENNFAKKLTEIQLSACISDTNIINQTLHFILQEIYYNAFIAQSDNYDFSFALKMLGKKAENSKNENDKKAFDDFNSKYNESKSSGIKAFMKQLQVEYNIYNAKTENNGNKNLKHYSLLLRQLLAISFWDYIQKDESLNFILTPKFNDSNVEIYISKTDISEFIDNYKALLNDTDDDAIVLGFYVLAKLIPPKEINFLKGDFLKYQQFIEDIKARSGKVNGNIAFIEKIHRDWKFVLADKIVKVLILCQQASGRVVMEKSKDDNWKRYYEF
jgi:hypothetical protein